MQVVIEYVFLENFLINLVLLKTTALLCKNKGRLFVLTAFFVACFDVVMPLLRLNGFGHFLVQAGLVCLSVCLSFKFRKAKSFACLFLAYFVSSFVYGGACFFFESLVGTQRLLMILGIVIGLFFVVKFLLGRFHHKSNLDNFCFEVEIETSGKSGKWKAFLDSGNLLLDPITKSPVNLVNFKVFSALFSDIQLEDLLCKSDKLKTLPLAHYVSFGTISGEDKILVFQVDNLRADGKTFPKAMLGLSFKNFDDAFGSDVILGSSTFMNAA